MSIHRLVAGTVQAQAFRNRYPGHAWLLARMDVVADPEVFAMGVSVQGRRIRLSVNPRFVETQAAFVPGVLLHEVHHVVLGHLTRPEFRGVAFPNLLTLAMEMAANEFIVEPLPEGAVVWETYRHLGMEAGQSTLQRYELLATAHRKGWEPPEGGPIDHHVQWDDACHPTAQPDPVACIAVRRLTEALLAKAPALDPGLRICGRTPGELMAELEPHAHAIIEMDWRQVLHRFCASASDVEVTFARPNRRFPKLTGIVPGWRQTNRRIRVLAAIDTSQSMTVAMLSAIAREVDRLARQADVIVAEVDSEVQQVYPYGGHIRRVMGRGGTDLGVVFRDAAVAAHHPDCVAYFTDGDGPWLPSAPPTPVLWVLTTRRPFGCPWGERVTMGSFGPQG